MNLRKTDMQNIFYFFLKGRICTPNHTPEILKTTKPATRAGSTIFSAERGGLPGGDPLNRRLQIMNVRSFRSLAFSGEVSYQGCVFYKSPSRPRFEVFFKLNRMILVDKGAVENQLNRPS
jgi:hypothetical protein